MSASASARPFRYSHSANMADLLERLQVGLMVTTYQAGKLAVFRGHQGRVSLLLRTFDRAMGLAVDDEKLAIGTRHQIWFMENDERLAHQVDPPHRYDACFLPRRCHVTGDIGVHEMAWGRIDSRHGGTNQARDELWIVNTRFSCLCTLDNRHSFVPRWRPAFVGELSGEDRCHLNGLAMRDGRPKYVTAFAACDAPQGWRDRKQDGGCIIDVQSGRIIAEGLAMPHSPRWHRDQLWVLDSGRGSLVSIDCHGHTSTVATFPGYVRGIAWHGQFALIGLSKIRDSATFSGIPIADERDQLRCGVWVYDLDNRSEVGFLEFEGDVTEVFDVQLLPMRPNPTVIGLQKDTIQRAFSIPTHIRWSDVPTMSDTQTPREVAGPASKPGVINDYQYLGPARRFMNRSCAADVWYVTYASQVDGGCQQAAKLFIPQGTPPDGGWPLGIWCHGLGDPAEQLRCWPCTNGHWRRSRGELAGGWAQHGIATLTPWLPGDGPSQPFATYSPFALDRNVQALADAVRMLCLLRDGQYPAAGSHELLTRFNLDRVVIRTDCAASPLLIAVANRLSEISHGIRVRALVADDFQPSILHNEQCLGPQLNRLPPESAAAIRCIWLRVLISLFEYRGWSLDGLVAPAARDLLCRPTATAHGMRPAIMTTQLVPPTDSEMARQVMQQMSVRAAEPTASDVQRWLYGDEFYDWAHAGDQEAMLTHGYYRKYFAKSDPFFADNITPFAPDVPLLVVGRTGDQAALLPGMPSLSEICEQLTIPKIRTLREWGWEVQLLESPRNAGTSFGGGPAQRWVLEQLQDLL